MILKLGSHKTLLTKFLRKANLNQPLVIWPSILVLLGLIAYPLGSVLLQSVFPKLFDQGFHPFSLSSFTSIFSQKYTYHAILNAFAFGIGSAIIATVLGTFFAIMIHRHWVHGQKFVHVVIWLIFFTPSYLMAEGWVLMLQDQGVVDELFHLPDGTFSWFFTPVGLVMAMGLRLFPVVYLIVKAALQGLGSDFEDAARTQGSSSIRVAIKIVLPLMMPAILAGATLAFAESASDFGFAAAFVPKEHIPMLTYSIYVSLGQMPVDYAGASALSAVLIGIIAIAIWLQKWILGRGSYSVIQNQIRPYRIDHNPSSWWSALSYVVLFLVFAFPLGGEIATSFLKNSSLGFIASNLTLHNYLKAFHSGSGVFPFGPALLQSLKLSIATAVTVTILGIGLGYVINQRKGLSTRFLYVLTMSTLAIPGIVLAAGYIFAWNAPYLIPFGLNFYGTLFCLYLAYVSGALPNSIRLQMAALTQISPSLLYAGQIQGAKTIYLFRKVVVPLISATTISVLFLTFSHAMFELPSSELLTPAGQSVLPIIITHFYTEGKIEVGSAITVMGICVILAAYLFGQLVILLYKQYRKVTWIRFFKGNQSVTTKQAHLNPLEREPVS